MLCHILGINICDIYIITDHIIYQVKVHYVAGKYVISLILLCVTRRLLDGGLAEYK